MNAEMTLDELRRLSEKATPGPWVAKVRGDEAEAFTAGTGPTLIAIGRRHDAKPDIRLAVAAVNYVRSILQENPR